MLAPAPEKTVVQAAGRGDWRPGEQRFTVPRSLPHVQSGGARDTRAMRTTPRTALALGALALGLSACSVTVRPNTGLVTGGSDLITRFAPTKGVGASYVIGEAVSFSVSTRTPGYLTLLALNPDGSANVLAQNVYVGAGTTVFPRPQDGVTYNVAPQRGLQLVRAVFLRVRPSADLVLGGVYDSGRWNTVTSAYVAPYAVADRDVQETYLYIR